MEDKKIEIQVRNLKKRYRDKEVLKGVTFCVPSGCVYALLGSNGAGKTTTVRILTTQIAADEGDLTVGGYKVSEEARKVREVISLTGQFSAVDENLTGRENLIFMGRLRQMGNPEKRAAELLEKFGLAKSADKLVSAYSGGMKRKLDIAMSLVGNSRVLFLDEPTTGLDPQSRRRMWESIQSLKEAGVTIFLTTQYLEEAEELADQIAILDRGVIIAEGTPGQLKEYLPQGAVQFQFSREEDLEKAETVLTAYRTLKTAEENCLTVFTDGSADALAEIFHLLVEQKIPIEEFTRLTPSLEDVFLAMIGEKEEDTHETDQQEI